MAVTVNYGSATLATVNDGQTATVNCAGKKMDGNISIVVPTASPQLVKGTMSIVVQSFESTYTFGFVIGMDWDLFLQTVGASAGTFEEDASGHITIYGQIIYFDGFPVTKQDAVIDGAIYTA